MRLLENHIPENTLTHSIIPRGFKPHGTTTSYFTDTGETANHMLFHPWGFRMTQHLTADFAVSLMTIMNDLQCISLSYSERFHKPSKKFKENTTLKKISKVPCALIPDSGEKLTNPGIISLYLLSISER